MSTDEPAKPVPESPLAFDANGDPLQVPATAFAWRVKKLATGAGRPRTLIDADTGRPLEVPLTATIQDLADAVCESGRYRLEAVDIGRRQIVGCIAVTEVILVDETPATVQATSNDPLPHCLQLIATLVETNARVMEAMVSAFGSVQPATSAPMVVQQPAESARPATMDLVPQLLGALKPIMDMIAAQKSAATTAK